MAFNYLAPAVVLLVVIAGIVLLLVPNPKAKVIGKLLLMVPLGMVLFFAWVMVLLFAGMASVYGIWYAVLAGVVLLSALLAVAFALFRATRNRQFYFPLVGVLAACVVGIGGIAGYEGYVNSIATVGELGDQLWRYDPTATTSADNKLAVLSQPSTLIFDKGYDLPIIDGATALYPVYAAFMHATYPPAVVEGKQYDLLLCSKTPAAYTNLINGDTDVIFVAGPSDKQLQEAADAGVELVLTPIGKEAFVFFVNANNSVSDLTVEQIQGIYTGELTKWQELGGSAGSIRAFQRPEGSGSQTALQRLMAGKALVAPPTENVVAGMGGIINRVADYRNFSDAIGYSFRFYSTEMVRNNEIKLLAVDGAAPTKENILNGSYPIVSDIYAVTLADASPETRQLVDWVLSPQGQEIIEATGYIAARG